MTSPEVLTILKIAAIVYLSIGAFLGFVLVGVVLVFGGEVVFDENENECVPVSKKEERKGLTKDFFFLLFLWLPWLCGFPAPRK